MASSEGSSAASTASNSAQQLYLHNMIGKVKLMERVTRGKDGRPGEKQLYMGHTEHNSGANLTFVVGDADVGRLATVIRAPSTYQNQGTGAFTFSLKLEGEDAEGARHLAEAIVAGMKQKGIIDQSLHPEVVKVISFPLITESNGAVYMNVTLGDDVEYLRKLTKGRLAGKFVRISRDEIRKGDRVVVLIKLDRHRDKPKHRFNRYAQRVFIIERDASGAGAAAIIGSSGKAVDVVDYDPTMEDEDEEGGSAGGAAAAAAAARPAAAAAPAGSSPADAEPADEEDAFEQAMKRARTAV
jgi:hypothetical protein